MLPHFVYLFLCFFYIIVSFYRIFFDILTNIFSRWILESSFPFLKWAIGILTGVSMNLQITLGSINILIILNSTIQEHGIYFYIFMSLIDFNKYNFQCRGFSSLWLNLFVIFFLLLISTPRSCYYLCFYFWYWHYHSVSLKCFQIKKLIIAIHCSHYQIYQKCYFVFGGGESV